jgi:hypothetical protein
MVVCAQWLLPPRQQLIFLDSSPSLCYSSSTLTKGAVLSIRKSVFETNSSSSHTVAVDERGADYPAVNVSGPVLSIEPGEYGWGYDELRSWSERASYAYTYAVNYGTSEDLDTLREVLEDFTKVPVKFSKHDYEDEYYQTGYIDHQSVDEAATIFRYDAEYIKNFIFGTSSYVIIDNDNN